MKKFFLENLNIIYYRSLFILISIFFLSKLYISYEEILGNGWAYNNLFINYSAGLVRRGLLGEIFLNINEIFNIAPLYFFTTLLFIAYFLQIFFFYKILKKYSDYKFFVTIIILSPVLLLFYIYDLNVFLAKDVFINLTILFHVFIVNQKIDEKAYKKILLYIIIPFLIISLANHENQAFFIPFHILITYYFVNNKNKNTFNINHLKPYIILFIPIIILLTTSGSFEKLSIINDSIAQFDASIYDQFAGNFNLAIGGFIKWHFFYHDVTNFIRLFFCFSLSIFLIYTFFNYLIKNKAIEINNILAKTYLLIIAPSFVILLIMLDHGRSLHMLSMHIISFYLLLDIQKAKLDNLFLKINNNYFLQKTLILFFIFYLFFWHLPQGGGFTGIGNFTTIFKGTFTNELLNIFLLIFNYVDAEIINLPRIII
tara:strand:+ start:375 stop:1655 length:1281 start_codon:yes stop_codon:yes gene_type:complete